MSTETKINAALGPAKWAPRTELGWQFDLLRSTRVRGTSRDVVVVAAR